MDDRDRVPVGRRRPRPAVEGQLAGVGPLFAGDDAHQRALAGAVRPGNAQHLARAECRDRCRSSAIVAAVALAARRGCRCRRRRSCRAALAQLGQDQVERDRADGDGAEEELLDMRSGRQQRQPDAAARPGAGPRPCVPMMVPLPPLRLAPPMITAAKTGKVCDRPMFGWHGLDEGEIEDAGDRRERRRTARRRGSCSGRPAAGRACRDRDCRRSPSGGSRTASGAAGTRRRRRGRASRRSRPTDWSEPTSAR